MTTEEERMEWVTRYILENNYEKLSDREAAKAWGCGTATFRKKFADYFEVPFVKFVKKLCIRQAAQEVHWAYKSIDSIAEKYGYQRTQFYKVFQREMGMSPKRFQKEGTIIPDVVCKSEINGHPLHMEYKKVDGVTMEGYPVLSKDYDPKEMFCAFAFSHPSSKIDLKKPEKQWGIWWHDISDTSSMKYVFGGQARPGEETPDGMARIRTIGGNYAVFSVERGPDYYDIVTTMKKLSWYVFRIWQPLNGKKMNTMGFIYEAFDEENCYLYVPLVKGIGGIEIEKDIGQTVAKIARYVDENILRQVSVEKVAEHFKYSVFFCCERFRSCYKLALEDYIKQKRLYALAGLLKDKQITERELEERYGYPTRKEFYKAFRSQFKVSPEEWESVDLKLIDMSEYYSEHFDRLKMTVKTIHELHFAGRIVKSGTDKADLDLDLPDLTEFWMVNDFSIEGSRYALESEIGEKIALYSRIKKEDGYHYMLGPVITDPEERLPEDMHQITVAGGKYAVFEAAKEAGAPRRMAELIRLMLRCIDQVWVYRNWSRTDFKKRISFFYYRCEKIYYLVPIS